MFPFSWSKYVGWSKYAALIVLYLGVSVPCPVQAQPATVVQLPTFSFFTVSTTVSVPDSGAGLVGGIRRSSSGHTAYGPFARGYGFGRQATRTFLGAQVHDLRSLDEALLAEAERAARDDVQPAPHPLRSRLNAAEATTASRPQGSLAQARRLRAAEVAGQQDQWLADLERGRQASEAGKYGAARIYLERVARQAAGESRQAALEELARLPRRKPALPSRDAGQRRPSRGQEF